MKAHILIDTYKESNRRDIGFDDVVSHAHTADLRVRGTLLRDVRGNKRAERR